jgi:hypothetical protein
LNNYTSSNVIGLASVAIFPCSSETGTLTSGTTLLTVRAPNRWVVRGLRASLVTAGTTATTIDILLGTATVFSGTNYLTIDATQRTSVGSTAPFTLNTSPFTINDDTEIVIRCISAGTSAAGLKVSVYYVLS